MVPNAFRRRDSTITIRVKEVRVIRIAGARDRTVNKRKICKTTATSPVPPVLSRSILRNDGPPGVTAPQHAGFNTPVKITKSPAAMIRGFKGLPISFSTSPGNPDLALLFLLESPIFLNC